MRASEIMIATRERVVKQLKSFFVSFAFFPNEKKYMQIYESQAKCIKIKMFHICCVSLVFILILILSSLEPFTECFFSKLKRKLNVGNVCNDEVSCNYALFL